MRCLTHIALVTVIQFITCIWLVGGDAETIMLLLHHAMAGTVYMVVLSNTKKTRCVG